MRTHFPGSDAPSLSLNVTSSPSSSLASVLEDDPFTMEDYAVGRLPPDGFLLSDPPTYHAGQSQPDTDTDGDSDLQSDEIVKVHYHLMLDGMLLFFIYIEPY